MIEAGRLNKRIICQVASVTAGEGVMTWTDVCTVWADIRPLVGTRRYQAKQLNSEVAGQIVIRYRTDITTAMRIKYGARYFEILAIINPDERNESLEIEYKELLD